MDLSFSGAGFMGCYYFGVVNCWNKYIPRERVRRVAGASAGSLIAAYYLMDLPLDECLKTIIEMTEDIRRRPLGVFDRSNQIVDVLPRVLDKLFPADAHKRVNGRLFVCMTRLRDMKCVIVNEFETRKDLIDALNCSSFIPVWSGNHVATYKGTKYIDGGFTNNMPVFDEHTIRICCFSGASDIAPYDRAQKDFMSASLMGMPVSLNWKNMRRAGRALWPPPPSYIIELLERGFHDTKSFILSNDLIQCSRCFKATEMDFQPIHSKCAPTISPAVSPSASRANSFMNLADLQRSASFRRRAPLENGLFSQEKNNSDQAKQQAADIKQLERLLQLANSSELNGKKASDLPSVFEGRRAKTGRQIKLKSLEQVATSGAKERKSFAKRLRERLARNKTPTSSSSDEETSTRKEQRQSDSTMIPNIVVEQAHEREHEEEREEVKLGSEKQPATIEEIMKQQTETNDDVEEEEEDEPLNGSSESSSTSASDSSAEDAGSQGDESSDSAVGGLRSSQSPPLVVPMGGRRMSQSPAEKFLASRKMSLVASQLDLQQQQPNERQQLLSADRFAFAPSQLPSCPPSPNLNRHCGECIRMRQQARMDEIDASIKCEAEKWGHLEERDPEREFSGFRYKLTGWLRQLGRSGPKYSYELYDSDQEKYDGNNSKPPQAANLQRRHSEIPTI